MKNLLPRFIVKNENMKKVKKILMGIVKMKYKKYIIVLAVGVVLIGILGDNSVLAHRHYKARIKELQQEKARYVAEYERTQAQIFAFETDVNEVRRIGRERHFMKMPDEDIFVLSDDTLQQKTEPGHETVE